MRARITLLSLMALTIVYQADGAPTSPGVYSGAALMRDCDKNTDVCMAYILGSADTLFAVTEHGGAVLGWRACPKVGTSRNHIFGAAIFYLVSNPKQMSQGATGLIAEGLQSVYPCQ